MTGGLNAGPVGPCLPSGIVTRIAAVGRVQQFMRDRVNDFERLVVVDAQRYQVCPAARRLQCVVTFAETTLAQRHNGNPNLRGGSPSG